MKPWVLVERALSPDGSEVTLHRHDTEYVIRAHGADLMSSRLHESEDALARLGCERACTLPTPCVLVGGLGMGFTLRTTLDLLPKKATVVVAELMPQVVEWNRGVLGPLAGHPIDDRRVRIEIADVALVMRNGAGRFDAVLLDVDNGPAAILQKENSRLYMESGLAIARASLKPGGVLAFWSAGEDRPFENRLRRSGFTVDTRRVRGRAAGKGPRHVVFLATQR